MKKLFLLSAALLASVSFAFAESSPVPEAELPSDARTFIAMHFVNDHVDSVEKENESRGTEYEVDLSSGAEVDFYSDGSWREIKAADGKCVPEEIVPEHIAKYVKYEYPDTYVTKIRKSKAGYALELSNKSNLRFSPRGKLIAAKH